MLFNRTFINSSALPARPVITLQPVAQSIVVGATLTFTAAASDAVSQQWYLDGVAISGATSATYTKANAQLSDDGDYFCRFTNAIGIKDTNTVAGVVVVAPTAPVITLQPIAQSIFVGASLSFSAAASDAISQQWYLDGSPISGATSTTYTKANAQLADSGNYFCRFTNVTGSTDTSTVAGTVAIEPTAPVITLQPIAQSIAVGATLTFTATASDAVSQQWYLGGVAISGATATTYTKANAQVADDGNYFCRFTNATGSTDTSTVAGTVTALPVITTQPLAQAITLGDTLTIIAAATGAVSQQWYLGGVAISGATSATYTKVSSVSGDLGNYYCKFTNTGGDTDTSTVAITEAAASGVSVVHVSQAATSATTGTLTMITPEANDFIVIYTSTSGGLARPLTSLSYDSVNGTSIGTDVTADGGQAVTQNAVGWNRANMPSTGGTYNYTYTAGTSNDYSLILVQYRGVDQTTPTASILTDTATAATSGATLDTPRSAASSRFVATQASVADTDVPFIADIAIEAGYTSRAFDIGGDRSSLAVADITTSGVANSEWTFTRAVDIDALATKSFVINAALPAGNTLTFNGTTQYGTI